jgi:N-acetylglucosaminyldiphosphoundecaprenol N-acetyl-beta-D-mannosaminyltransferase
MAEQFQELRILGVRFHKLTVDQLLDYIADRGHRERQTVVAYVNVYGMNLAYKMPWYKDFLNEADLVICDGFGVALGAKLLGQPIEAKHRTTCPDWIETLVQRCAKENLSIFLLAGEPGVATAAAAKFRQAAPGIRLEHHHGYFAKSGEENDQVLAFINEFKPDILYIGFGMPLQEQWIRDNRDRIAAKVMLPQGACLDFYTGQRYRAPRLFTDHGLEWLARLLTEPRRLWKRYIVGNPLFLWRILKQKFGHNQANDKYRNE